MTQNNPESIDPDDVPFEEGLKYRDHKLNGIHQFTHIDDEIIVHESWSDEETEDGKYEERCVCVYDRDMEDNFRLSVAQSEIIAVEDDYEQLYDEDEDYIVESW